MKDSTIKIKILKTLLGSPKTIGEIAIELGYIDKKGHGKYNVIDADLKSLEQYGFIHRVEQQKKRLGAPPTTYDIVYDISVLRDIVKKYESLIPDLQKSDKIINLVFSHIKKETYSDFLYGGEEHKKISDFIPDMFRYSVTFLKMFLANDSYMSSFYRTFYLLHCREEFFKEYSEEDFMQDSKFNNFDCFEVLDIDTDRIFFEAFNHSVINDFINGNGNPEGLKLIETLRENEFNRSDYETLQIEIDKTEDYPAAAPRPKHRQ